MPGKPFILQIIAVFPDNDAAIFRLDRGVWCDFAAMNRELPNAERVVAAITKGRMDTVDNGQLRTDSTR
jgi:hypothetical protein